MLSKTLWSEVAIFSDIAVFSPRVTGHAHIPSSRQPVAMPSRAELPFLVIVVFSLPPRATLVLLLSFSCSLRSQATASPQTPLYP